MFWHPDISLEGGPYKTVLKRGEFTDASRLEEDGSPRTVPFKIYVPVLTASPAPAGVSSEQEKEPRFCGENTEGKMPVIIWSHGFGGNRDGAAFLSRFIASYGYTIVHLTHRGTDSSLWEGKPGHPWDILRKVSVSRETTLKRFMDVPFALDELPKWAALEENAEFGRFMDFETLGMSGHSFGAMTSQVMAGQMFPDENGMLKSYKENRFKAGILYSPVPIRHLVGEEPEGMIYGPISIPLLHMTGTEDDSPIEGFGYERRMGVYEHSDHPEKHILIKQGGDHMVYNGTRGKLEANDLRERHEDIIKTVALAYWDYQLKGNKAAKEWLEGEGLATYLSQDGEFKAHTP